MATTQSLEPSAIAGFAETVRGPVLEPNDSDYDAARAVWNGMIDRHPALVVQAAGTADVVAAVRFAREHDLVVAVKGGGHNVAGNAVCDDGLVIDLSAMNDVRVDPARKTARVGPGATIADVDHETQAFGLATPLGTTSFTGIAGLTLGGGIGWLSRAYGLSLDNLRAVDLVSANGTVHHANREENPELFWGVRGGGGNFGVVTSFEFDLHEVGPEVLAGPIVYAGAHAADVIGFVREFTDQAPDEATVVPVLRHAPPLPFLPEAVHGTPVVIVAAFYAGDPTAGEEVLEPLRAAGEPIADAIGRVPYVAWQQGFDALYPPGRRNYWKSTYVPELTDETIRRAVDHAVDSPSPHGELVIFPLGGAINRVQPDATAYPHRDAAYWLFIRSSWDDPADDDACRTWTRDFFDALPPSISTGAYANFVSEGAGEESRVYGKNLDRLVQLKDEWDPHNVFRLNQNIRSRS